jgi:hypothetical protein
LAPGAAREAGPACEESSGWWKTGPERGPFFVADGLGARPARSIR